MKKTLFKLSSWWFVGPVGFLALASMRGGWAHGAIENIAVGAVVLLGVAALRLKRDSLKPVELE